MKPQSVRLEGATAEKLKELSIAIQGVELKTYDDKINHLVWFYSTYRDTIK